MLGKRSSLALSAAMSLLAMGSPSYALDFDSLLRTYLGNKYPGVNVENQADIKTTINNRQAQVEQQIEAGAASGQLTAAEEQELRDQLNHVAFLEGSYLADGTLSPTEIQSLVDELTNTSRKLQTYLANSAVTGYAGSVHTSGRAGYRDMLGKYGGRHSGETGASNQAAIKAVLDSKQAELDSKIATGLANGSLTLTQTRNLRVELQKIRVNEVAALADGRMNYSEEKQLTDQLASLDTSIQAQTARWMANNRGRGHGRGYGYGQNRTASSVSGYSSLLRQRIETGVSSGRLTRSEASRLREMESQTSSLQAQLHASGGRLSHAEERQLLAELDALNAKITKDLNDKEIW